MLLWKPCFEELFWFESYRSLFSWAAVYFPALYACFCYFMRVSVQCSCIGLACMQCYCLALFWYQSHTLISFISGRHFIYWCPLLYFVFALQVRDMLRRKAKIMGFGHRVSETSIFCVAWWMCHLWNCRRVCLAALFHGYDATAGLHSGRRPHAQGDDVPWCAKTRHAEQASN